MLITQKLLEKIHSDNLLSYENLNHLPPSQLHNLPSPWPFSTWGIDIIGQITPKASNGHQFLLVAVDYFTKWVEAASFSKLGAKQVAKFFTHNSAAMEFHMRNYPIMDKN